MFTTPPPVASDVSPLESSVETLVSPVTSSVVSRVTASSTLSVPLIVVAEPDAPISIAPPPSVVLAVVVAKTFTAVPAVALVILPTKVILLHLRSFHPSILKLPTVSPFSVLHSINAKWSSDSSHINPVFATFVSEPSPLVNIKPKS